MRLSSSTSACRVGMRSELPDLKPCLRPPVLSSGGELGFGNRLGESLKRELVPRRSITVCSVLRGGNGNSALAVLNKHLAVAH
jgi:hypothetical protein